MSLTLRLHLELVLGLLLLELCLGVLGLLLQTGAFPLLQSDRERPEVIGTIGFVREDGLGLVQKSPNLLGTTLGQRLGVVGVVKIIELHRDGA